MNVKIHGNVKHNGKHYKSGDTIKKVKKEDGERLIKLGIAESTEEQQDPPGKGNDDPGAGESGE